MGSRLRVTVLVDRFPELSETFIANELHELQRLGFELRVEAAARAPHPHPDAVVGIPASYIGEEERSERARALAWLAFRHPLRVARDLLVRSRWRHDEPVPPLRRLAPTARRVATWRADHLHVHFAAGAALSAMRLSMLLGLPYSVATHGYDIFESPANLVEKHERAAFAVTPCEYSLGYLRRLLGSTAGGRVHKVVVGVDGERHRRRTPYAPAREVLAVARLVEKKGLTYLLEASALLRDVRVRIVGDGPLRGELVALAERHGVDHVVDFLGPQSPDAVRSLLEQAALLVMPSVVAANGDRDTMPVVVKEALSMEVPVVATNEVGLPEVVRSEWGRLVPPRDAAALAAAIDELLALPVDVRAEMGRAGRQFVLENCSLRRETERLAALIAAGGREQC